MAPPVTRWLLCAGVLTAAASPHRGEEYVEVPGIRCAERKDHYPLGQVGGVWTEYLHVAARESCDGDANCSGFMRFVGQNHVSCRQWCGRPQFCVAGVTQAQANGQWVSYIKQSHIGSFDSVAPPEEPRQLQIQCPDTDRGTVSTVFLLRELVPTMPEGACNVLHHRFGHPEPSGWSLAYSKGLDSLSQLDGILSEAEDADFLPFFSADLPPEGDPGAWRYFLDAHDYPAKTLGSPGVKRKFLSIYFLDAFTTCPGPKDTVLTPQDAEEELPGHVYVDDGSHEAKLAAFEEYQITVLCGDFDQTEFPPAGLVYSLAYASHPIVPQKLHQKLTQIFFHMQDAAQPYKNVHIPTFQRVFGDMFTDETKDKQVHFKQTFMFLAQQLLFYRYREPVQLRAASAACVICAGRNRSALRRQAAAAALEAGQPKPRESVAYVFSSMSRRSAHALRQAVRETWARLLAERSATLNFFVGEGEAELGDANGGVDVVQLPVPESYRTINVKALLMLEWTYESFPHMEWIIRHDDDVYLRPAHLLNQLVARPPVRYLWGNFDHGSTPQRDPEHQHYNTYEQCPPRVHPVWGDIFPPYARGHLWAMSVDLLGEIVRHFKMVREGRQEATGGSAQALAESLPHPDDPALGIVISTLVQSGMSINLDDRDFNSFSLNPSCNSTFSNMHGRTWAVHHVGTETMRCMWAVDEAASVEVVPSDRLPDLCACSTEVEEEEDLMYDGMPFWYPKNRFNR